MEETHEEIIKALSYGIIFILFLMCSVILLFYYSRKKIIQKEIEKAQLKVEQKQKVLQTTINTQEEERKRIAQDLHDDISAKLNVINLTTHMLLADETISDTQRDSLSHILNVNTNTLEVSRKIAHDLLPPVLDKFGLKVALEELFDDFTKSKQLTIKEDVEETDTLNSETQLHLFRITQELINNSIRHGKATEITISLKVNEDKFNLDYKDNGIGFDVKEVTKNSGIGLQNIESRAEILNASLKILSTKNEGCIFVIQSNIDE